LSKFDYSSIQKREIIDNKRRYVLTVLGIQGIVQLM